MRTTAGREGRAIIHPRMEGAADEETGAAERFVD
jgi:hypothetical protein